MKDDSKFYQVESLSNTYIFWTSNNEVAAFFSISNNCLTADDGGFFNNKVWNRFHRKVPIPNSKRIKQYPAVLVGRLGVDKKYHKTGLAYQLMSFIKEYAVIDCKPACRLLLLEAVNKERQISFYKRNDFMLMLNDENDPTRLMYFDLDRLRD